MPEKQTKTGPAQTKGNNTPKKGGVKVDQKDAEKIKAAAKPKTPTKSNSKGSTKSNVKGKNNKQDNDSKKSEATKGAKSKNTPKQSDAKSAKGSASGKKTGKVANSKSKTPSTGGNRVSAVNQAVGTTLNLSLGKKALIKFVADNKYYHRSRKEQDEDAEKTYISVSSAYCAYVVIAEFIVKHLATESSKFMVKSAKDADLYTITLNNIMQAIRDSAEYGPVFKNYAEAFVKNMITVDFEQGFFDSKNLKVLLEKETFKNAKNVMVDVDAKYFLCYITSQILSTLSHIACRLTCHMKKKYIGVEGFKFACDTLFSGPLLVQLTQTVDDAAQRYAAHNKKDENTETEGDAEGSAEGDEDGDGSGDDGDENGSEDGDDGEGSVEGSAEGSQDESKGEGSQESDDDQ